MPARTWWGIGGSKNTPHSVINISRVVTNNCETAVASASQCGMWAEVAAKVPPRFVGSLH